ncbi:hypothetical protein L2Y94_18905 [Luteibacter aegosomatis]|uniref:hypothetical protein n=1 Tax=Luteibacter aegosomatis TaxID=2911537 RepID=UPI001FFC2932|nr:hypothetical protein [Luteibacter aegosomatis]UPG85349.1 hypothetical protein L2Y94_18905 [Luteibacter aegosomatis]
MPELIKKIFRNLWSLSAVLSFLLFLATAIIYVKWKDNQVVMGSTKFILYAAIAFFLLAIVSYYLPPRAAKRWGPAPTGSITSPRPGDHCPVRTDFLGEIYGRPRDGWEFWLVRRFTDRDPFYPEAKIKLNVQGKDKKRTWSADKVWVGGEAKLVEERHFELWMVSPDVSAFFEHSRSTAATYWAQVNAYRDKEKRDGREIETYPFKPLPGFDGKLTDIVELATVRVYRDPAR